MYILKKIKKGEEYDFHHPNTNFSAGRCIATQDFYQVRQLEGNSCWMTAEYHCTGKDLKFIRGYYGKGLIEQI